MSETIHAWTRQVPQVLDELERTGVYRVREEYVRLKNDTMTDYYLELYRWLTYSCRSCIKIPEDADLPVWLSLTEGTRLGAVEGAIALELEVPADELFILDYNKWGYRVNDWYVPLDAEDERKHNEELKSQGISNEAMLIMSDKGNFYPAMKQKIIRSWRRVIEDGPNEDPEQNVGVVWELRREWVKGVETFEG